MNLNELISKNPKLFRNDYIRYFKQGTYLLHQGDDMDCIYFVLKGAGIVNQVNEEGEERVVHHFRQGDCAGKGVFFNRDGCSPSWWEAVSIIAKTDCKVYQIPLNDCHTYANHHVDIYKYLIQTISDELFRSKEDQLLLRENKTAGILCTFLQEHIEEVDGALVVDKWFSYADLTQILGIHSVTSSRIIKKLLEEGILSKGKKCFYIHDLSKLTSYATGQLNLQYYQEKKEKVSHH